MDSINVLEETIFPSFPKPSELSEDSSALLCFCVTFFASGFDI